MTYLLALLLDTASGSQSLTDGRTEMVGAVGALGRPRHLDDDGGATLASPRVQGDH